MDPIVNIRIEETGMSIQNIEKEIAAQIRKHEAQLKHWRAVKAATAKLRGITAARAVRKGIEQSARRSTRTRTRTVKKAVPYAKGYQSQAANHLRAVKAADRAAKAVAADRAPRRKPTVGKLIAGTK